MKEKLIRQGDIMLVPGERPLGEPTKSKELTVALGEATGHHHTLYGDGQVSHWQDGARRFVEVDADYFLRHQEHHEHQIMPGVCYEILTEEEYDPFAEEMKKVVD